MDYAEDDLLPISALQHLVFCERQCALIHLEGLWADNRLTAEGAALHERADEGPDETRGDVRTLRGLPVRSLRLGLIGRCDVVECERVADAPGAGPPGGVVLPGREGRWLLAPVEYKRGRPKPDECDLTQLTAQALCLEEMFATTIAEGAIFYGQPRRRLRVELDAGLRERTLARVARLRELLASGLTPPSHYEKKCDQCSLIDLCQPRATAPGHSARAYLERAARRAAEP